MIKSITARRIFEYNSEVKKKLWGGEFWLDGYWMITVSQNRTEETIREYVKNQGYNEYIIEHKQDIHDVY